MLTRLALRFPLVGVGLLALPAFAQQTPPPQVSPSSYTVRYEATLVPTQRSAHVTIRIGNGSNHVRAVRFQIDPTRHRDFTGNGRIQTGPDWVEWHPPDGLARIEYDFLIDDLRDERSYDARCAEDWALFRGDDLVPPARVRTLKGAEASATLRVRRPKGWSVATPYRRRPDGLFEIDHPDRRFDRPTGWMVVGRIGVLRETVAGVKVAVAGPLGHGLRRLDILALLRWTLPSLRDALGTLPDRLLVVGAGDPMWRGGLSGPNSLFIHADRPLIANDGTSPMLHELMHTVLRLQGGSDADWIVEGLAELYAVELLRRSKTISRRRYRKTLDRLAERGASVRKIEVDRASGAVVARAVTVLHELDQRIRTSSDGSRSLDDVLRQLLRHQGALETDGFQALAESIHGESLASFFRRRIAASSGG